MLISLSDLRAVWEGWGGVWGGHFQDPIHFEFPGFPHAAVESAGQSGYVKAANIAASFLPGGVGLLASVSPAFAGGKSKYPWWDPFGYITNRPECRGCGSFPPVVSPPGTSTQYVGAVENLWISL